MNNSGFPKIEEGLLTILTVVTLRTKITWYVDDEYAKLEQTVISFSFARLGSVTPQIQINVADILIGEVIIPKMKAY